MDLAIKYIREARSYLEQLEPEIFLDDLFCESYEEHELSNNTTSTYFLESGNTDGEKKDDNKEIKKKASSSLKKAIARIIDVIKRCINSFLDFFRELFSEDDAVTKCMEKALNSAYSVVPSETKSIRIKIEDNSEVIKKAKECVKELSKARKSGDPQRIEEAKKNLTASIKVIGDDNKVSSREVNLDTALKLVQDSGSMTKKQTVEVKRLQEELTELNNKLDEDDEMSANIYPSIVAAQLEMNALMEISKAEQEETRKTTTSFFGAIKSLRKLMKSDSEIEKAQAAAEVIDAATNNPRVNKFCKGLSKVGSVVFDKGRHDGGMISALSRAKTAEAEAATKRTSVGSLKAKSRALGGYATAINKALNDETATKMIGAVADKGKRAGEFVKKYRDDMEKAYRADDD